MAADFRIAAGNAVVDAGSTTIASSSVAVATGDTAYVLVFHSDGTPAATTSCAWDAAGVNEPLTRIHESGTILTFGRFEVYRAQNLTAKTATFTATWAANKGERGIVVWLGTGVDTTTPNGTLVSATGTNTSISVTASTSTNQRVLGFGYTLDTSGAATTLNLSSPNGTERREEFASPYDVGAAQDIVDADGGTQAITWTVSNTSGGGDYRGWYAVAIPLNDLALGASNQLAWIRA